MRKKTFFILKRLKIELISYYLIQKGTIYKDECVIIFKSTINSRYSTIETPNKRLLKSINIRNSTLFCADRFSRAYIVGTGNKEKTRNKEPFCAYQLLPYCEFRLQLHILLLWSVFYLASLFPPNIGTGPSSEAGSMFMQK